MREPLKLGNLDHAPFEESGAKVLDFTQRASRAVDENNYRDASLCTPEMAKVIALCLEMAAFLNAQQATIERQGEVIDFLAR